MTRDKTEVFVYGAGVSGLIAAYYLNKKKLKVSIVDPFNEPVLQTHIKKEGLIEWAANSLLMNLESKELLDNIGLEYINYSEAGKKKFFYRSGELCRWPLNFIESLQLIPFFFKILFFKKYLKPKQNVTLKNWSLKHLPEAFYERVFKRGLQGVYGPNIDKLSSNLVLKPFLDQRKSKSLGSVSFKSGMQELPKKLKDYLTKNGVIFLKQEPVGKKAIRVVSTPAHSLPSCVDNKAKEILEKVMYHNISIVTFFVNEDSKMPFSGFGAVFEDEPGVLGLILNSELFENRASEGLSSETWIVDGTILKDESNAIDSIQALRHKMIGKESDVTAHYYKNWERAFPVYDIKLENALKELEVSKDLFYFANWTGSLGIGKLIAKGKSFSEEVCRSNNISVNE